MGRQWRGLRISQLHDDLGETCCPNRLARLARLAGIRAQIGYKRRPGKYGRKPSVVVDNTLDRKFDVDAPDQFWVTDIAYIKTFEGFSYLAVIIDLYSRKVVGWAMQSRQPTDLVLQALMMAVWRCKPSNNVLIHSPSRALLRNTLPGSGSRNAVYQYGMGIISKASQSGTQYEPPLGRLLRNRLPGNGRGNCHDNAVAESFFNLLKRERVRA